LVGGCFRWGSGKEYKSGGKRISKERKGEGGHLACQFCGLKVRKGGVGETERKEDPKQKHKPER